MKSYWTLKIFALAMLLLMTTSVANADEWSGHFNLSVLLKTLKSDDWPNLNKHFCIGFITDIKRTSWPISIALDKLDTGSEYDVIFKPGHRYDFTLAAFDHNANRHSYNHQVYRLYLKN